MKPLDYWVQLAVLNGHVILHYTADAAVMESARRHRMSHGAWGVGLIALLLLAIVTLGFATLLIPPYVLLWALLAARSRTHRSRRYVMSITSWGQLVTSPGYIANDLREMNRAVMQQAPVHGYPTGYQHPKMGE